MEITIRFKGALLVVALAAGLAAWLLLRGVPGPGGSETSLSVVAPEVPVVMRSPGGLLEIATVRAYERFSREDTREFWGVDLGTTVSQIQATVVYRYHIELAREWPMILSGTTCIVHAGPVQPSLPVAFDTGTLQKYSRNGWARFNSEESLDALEHSLTPQLQSRAASSSYLQLAREAGRKTVAEFVTNWLVKEHQWKRDPRYQVVVLYPGESLPAVKPVDER